MLQCMHIKLSRCCSSNLVFNLREPGSLFREEQCIYIHYHQGDNNIKASNRHLSPSEGGLNLSLHKPTRSPHYPLPRIRSRQIKGSLLHDPFTADPLVTPTWD